MNDAHEDRPSASLAGAVARVVAWGRIPLNRNALVLMVNAGLAAGLGFVFWAIAARLYPPAQLGLASAAISSALFVTTVAQFGLPYALVRFAPTAVDRAGLTSTIVALVTFTGVAAGAVFIAGMGLWAPALAAIAPGIQLAVAVMALAGTTAASTALVYVAVGARDTRPALVGGFTHGAVKSALLVLFAVAFARLGFAVVLAWLLGTTAAVLVQMRLLRTNLAWRVDLHLVRLGSFLRYCAGNYAGDLAWTAPGLLFPLLVVGVLGAEANAYFYIAWAIAGLLAGIPTAVASSLLAEGSHSHGETEEHLRRAAVLTLAIVLPAIAICWLTAPWLLSLFGAPYAAKGVDALRLLSLAALPLSLNTLHLAVARVDRAIGRIVAITAFTGAGALVLGAALVAQQGTAGIALAYLIAQSVMAVALTAQWWLQREGPLPGAPGTSGA